MSVSFDNANYPWEPKEYYSPRSPSLTDSIVTLITLPIVAPFYLATGLLYLAQRVIVLTALFFLVISLWSFSSIFLLTAAASADASLMLSALCSSIFTFALLWLFTNN